MTEKIRMPHHKPISHRNVVPDWMGYPGTEYSRYDPLGDEQRNDVRGVKGLEGAGRRGWDQDQNRAYSSVYGNVSTHRRNHKGRGPKNYRRSDERILDDIVHVIREDPRIDLSDVEIHVKDGSVYLTGAVHERAVRHLIEDMIETISGVKHVENSIRTPVRGTR